MSFFEDCQIPMLWGMPLYAACA